MNEQQDHGLEQDQGTSEAPSAPEERGGDVLSLIADVEAHLTRIRNVQSRQQSEFADLSERQRRVSSAESLIEERSAEITRLQDEISEARRRLDAEQGEVESARQELESTRSQYESESETLRIRAQALEEISSRNERAEGENAEERGRLECWASELDGRERDCADRVSVADAERERIQAEMDAAAAEFDTRLRAHEADERRAIDQREALELRIEESTTRIAELESENSTAQESCDAARAETADIKSRVGVLEQELHQKNGDLSDLEARLAAQDDVVEQGVKALEAAQSRVHELEAVTEEDQRQLQLAGQKLVELAKAIAEQAPRLERGAEAMALVVELEAEIDRLRTESEQRREDIEAPLTARISDLEAGLELARKRHAEPGVSDADVEALVAARTQELRDALEAATTASEDAAGADVVSRATFDELKAECRRLERRGDELETALSMTTDRGQAQEMAKQLRRRAERVGDIARHLDCRKARLRAMRATLRAREDSLANRVGGTENLHDIQRIEAQRAELEEVRDFLARSEQQMVTRWARPRSFATVAWLMLILAMSAAAGWIGMERIMPGTGSATLLLTAKTADGTPLGARAAGDWDEWHRALATDPAFVAVVQQRLAMRGMDAGATEARTAELLADHLSFEDEGTGRLRLVLAGEDRRTVEPTLDAIATAMVSESSRQAPRREQGARATLPQERPAALGGGYAASIERSPDPDMLIRGGAIAAGVFAASLILVGLVYSVLSRSKRVFESRESGNDVPATA